MRILFLVLILLATTNLHAVSVFYNKTSSAVVTIGNVALSDHSNPDIVQTSIPDNSPLRKDTLDLLVWDGQSQSVVRKSDKAISDIIASKEQKKTLAKIRLLKQLQSEANQMISSGLEVDISTADLQIQLSAATADYNSKKQ